MFRDEGTEPSVQFRLRMTERVERIPTSLLLTAMPFLAVARIVLILRDHYVRARCSTLSKQIDAYTDLRTQAQGISIGRFHVEKQIS